MTDRNDDLFSAARAVIPGGVNSPVRAYGSVGGTPRFLASAKGATVTDAAGREYVDLVASWAPLPRARAPGDRRCGAGSRGSRTLLRRPDRG